MNPQTIRNRAFNGLPVAISEGSMTGFLASEGRAFDFFGGDGKLRRMQAIPAQQRARRPYRRLNGPVVTIRPTAA